MRVTVDTLRAARTHRLAGVRSVEKPARYCFLPLPAGRAGAFPIGRSESERYGSLGVVTVTVTGGVTGVGGTVTTGESEATGVVTCGVLTVGVGTDETGGVVTVGVGTVAVGT